MRSLFLLVLLIAAMLGGWSEWRRRQAVDQLVGQLSGFRSNINISIFDTSTFGPQIQRIRALHGESMAVDAVMRVFHDAHKGQDYWKAEVAIACLLRMQPESTRVVPDLIDVVRDEDFPSQPESSRLLKTSVLLALGKLGRNGHSGKVITALRQVLGNPVKSQMNLILQYAVLALSEMGPLAKDAVPDLARLVSDSDPEIRRLAVVALGHIGPTASSAIPAILAALKDPDDQVRIQSIISLGLIAHNDQRTPEIIAAVEKLARNEPDVDDLADLTLRRLRRQWQFAENRTRLLPHLAPEARKRFLEKVVADEARETR